MRMIPFSPISIEPHLLPIRIVSSSSRDTHARCVPSAPDLRIDVELSSFARNMPPPVGEPNTASPSFSAPKRLLARLSRVAMATLRGPICATSAWHLPSPSGALGR